ncbi:DUF5688 family protein [Anaeromicropila populeti]|uniref:Uncharacterized protein n=1 Tax=Anaeromicropila populeti TaxID=37658 RepID=A0A1I6INQ8_9FIRM|nr:DUF5688 family protein [Anaeromicropila populeti]SFR68364.1 hypothetical protein SAMN05661086_00955 [Anaeromicropila populeti]
MEYLEFVKTVESKIKERAGEGYTVRVNQVVKNNEVYLDGLVILKEESKISPNIYLNGYYEQYLKGKTVEEVVLEIWEIYEASFHSEVIKEFDLPLDLDSQKDKIIFRLVHYERNKERLKGIPHLRFLDLAITFHCLVSRGELGVSTLTITNIIKQKWKISLNELMRYAVKNTQQLFPVSIRRMEEVIFDIMQSELISLAGESPEEESDSYACQVHELIQEILEMKRVPEPYGMYVMSNLSGVNGAASLLYEEVLQEFACSIQSNLYILPSSIHEIIIIPYSNALNVQQLKSMVKEVNQTQVPREDILSDRVYIYSYQEHSFQIM